MNVKKQSEIDKIQETIAIILSEFRSASILQNYEITVWSDPGIFALRIIFLM